MHPTLTTWALRLLSTAVALLAPRGSPACSAFLLEGRDGPVVGKSYDWSDERGVLVVNPRGLAKRALVLAPGATPAAWSSRFASLTFNQYGRELPNGGINESGLVVEVLILQTSVPARPDDRAVVTELGLVQYLLDQAATTREAVALARAVRVAPAYAPLHYFVCDAQAECAALELLGGKLVVSTGADMVARALTNSEYAESARALAAARGAKKVDRGMSSLQRFVRVAQGAAARSDSPGVARAWSLLESVQFDAAHGTQWQIVYEPRERRVHFRSRRHPSVKTVALGALNGACGEPAMTLSLGSDASGEVSGALTPYSEAANLELVRATLAPMLSKLPPGIERRVAAHPGTLSCPAP